MGSSILSYFSQNAQAAVEDGAANCAAELAKRLRYPAVAAAGLQAVQPFSVETFGRLGDGSLQVLHAAWQRLQERRREARGWKGLWMFHRWLALLSCVLQRSFFEAEQAVVGDLRLAPLEAPLAPTVLPFLPTGFGHLRWRAPSRRGANVMSLVIVIGHDHDDL